jgi:hypothetical protein
LLADRNAYLVQDLFEDLVALLFLVFPLVLSPRLEKSLLHGRERTSITSSTASDIISSFMSMADDSRSKSIMIFWIAGRFIVRDIPRMACPKKLSSG